MSDVAQELDMNVMGLVRDALRDQLNANPVVLTSIVIEVIRHINEEGYMIVAITDMKKEKKQ